MTLNDPFMEDIRKNFARVEESPSNPTPSMHPGGEVPTRPATTVGVANQEVASNHGVGALADSGARTTFATGAQREKADEEGSWWLIPFDVLDGLARWYAAGAKKYSPRNWQKGLPLSSFFNSAARHLFKLGERRTDERHDLALLWNVVGFIWTDLRIKSGLLPAELDDIHEMPDVTTARPPMAADSLYWAVEALKTYDRDHLEALARKFQQHPGEDRAVGELLTRLLIGLPQDYLNRR